MFARPQKSAVRGWHASLVALLVALALIAPHFCPRIAAACGGFFCSRVPVDQVGEEIIFRQDGDQITAIVRIQYTGPAADFSWVVPVPGVPSFALSSDLLFQTLEPASRPRFLLRSNGEACPSDLFFLAEDSLALSSPGSAATETVQVLEQVAVGPFDIQVVRSDDPNALATWLVANNYDLTERGVELIAPYVEEGMNFVAVRLQKDKNAGDIQPLKMVYTSTQPMIPIRLTAVATQPNLGVVVWILGSGRAVPLNYLHIVPNYAKIDWFGGFGFGSSFGAYASYQQLITDAMDEAGGQGFATDYAGPSAAIVETMPDAEAFAVELQRLAAITDDADAIAGITNGQVFRPASNDLLSIFSTALPLPAGQTTFVYQSAAQMRSVFSASQLAAGRLAIFAALENDIVANYADAIAVFDGNPDMTRMYTTLSADEMTLDPVFSFNPDLPGQALEREATLELSCAAGTSQWALVLGPGTGRDGELVARGSGSIPFAVPDQLQAQSSIKTATRLTERGTGSEVTNNRFGVEFISGDVTPLCGTGAGCGLLPLMAAFTGLAFWRSRRIGPRF